MISNLINALKDLFNFALVKVKVFLGIKLTHRYKDFFIKLPAYHFLPVYQRIHPKYDRFLPHLVKYFPNESSIVDVGANCGDTLAGMVDKNPKLQYICVEPDQDFYDELQSNIYRIKEAHPNLNVVIKKNLVGKSIKNVSLDGFGGTKHAVVGMGSLMTKSLDEILGEINPTTVRLLKSDVDGFDYDVIDSARKFIESKHPIIFFECQNNFEYQKKGFEGTIAWLKSIGYIDWVLFDNFGELVLRTDNIENVYQLINYVWPQNNRLATRTIYYFDILACVRDDSKLIDLSLSTY